MTANPDDAPPPYTETDIYSNAGGSGGRSPISASHRTNSLGDNLSTAGRSSTTSSPGDAIYTPPLTPRSSHQQTFSPEPGAGSNSTFPSVVSPPASAAAAAYFESRPPPPALQASAVAGEQIIQHTISFKADSAPDDFPYPEALAARDVTVEDWQTFVNYLLPNYSSLSNLSLIDRKLRAEGLSPAHTGNSNSNDDARSATSGRSHAEAQLEQIRTPVEQTGAGAARPEHIEQTLREWNDGFFGPRAALVLLQLPVDDLRIPGAWDGTFDSNASAENRPAEPQQQQQQHPGPSSETNVYGNSSRGPGSGFRIGGLTLDHDRIAFGDSLVLDSNGVRIGGFTADNNGIRLRGQSLIPNIPGLISPHHAPPGLGIPVPRGIPNFHHAPPPVVMGPFSHSMPHIPGAMPDPAAASPPTFQPAQHPSRPQGASQRGRLFGRRGSHSRSSSVSSEASSSSSSSSSSSGSDASYETLPAYEDLPDAQLPAARDLLRQWLQRTEQPITRESAQALREQISATAAYAKTDPNAKPPLSSPGPPGGPSTGERAVDATRRSTREGPSSPPRPPPQSVGPPISAQDRAAIRRDIKELRRQWKARRRTEHRQRRQERRDRKAKRRAEKRERRQRKRELRKSKRENRRQRREDVRDMRRGHRRGSHGDHGPFVPVGVPGVGVPDPVSGPTHHRTEPPSAPGFPPFMGGLFGGAGPGGRLGGGRCGARPVGRGGCGWGGGGLGGPDAHGWGGFGGWGGGGWAGPGARGWGRRGAGGGFGGVGRQQQPQEYRATPGSWPGDDDAGAATGVQQQQQQQQPSREASQAKYREADQVDAVIEQRRADLARLREQASASSSAASLGGIRGRIGGVLDDKRRIRAGSDVAKLEHEIEQLEVDVARLRLEGDSEFARELAEEEQRNWGGN